MSYERRALVADESTTAERVAAGVVGLCAITLVAGIATIFQWVGVEDAMLGLALFDLYGVALLVAGTAVVGLGVASRVGLFETSPDRSAGLVTGGLFALIAVVAGGLVASQTLGLGLVGWLPVALGSGIGVGALTVLTREDVGSTLPAGLLALGVGGLLLGDVLTAGWSWQPTGFSATFAGPVVIPVLAAFAALVVGWAGAKAYAGFGTRGRQAGAHMLVSANAAAMLGVLVLLVLYVAKKGAAYMLQGIKLGFFTAPVTWFHLPVADTWVVVEAPGIWFHWPFVMTGYSLSPDVVNGVLPAIVGTFWLVLGSVLFAVPLGVGAAVFLTEYAEQGRFTQVVETATNGLWSTPSIVYGLFGFAFLVPRFGNTNSLLAGQLVLGFMLLPLVLITSRESLKSVPDEYRDASAALGVSQWETIKSVVLPASMPGVITGVILGVGRIAGETAPLILVMNGDLQATAPIDVLGSFQFTASPPFISNSALLTAPPALPYKLYGAITAGVVSENPSFGWATALVLLLVVLSFYAVGIASRVYFRRKLEQ